MYNFASRSRLTTAKYVLVLSAVVIVIDSLVRFFSSSNISVFIRVLFAIGLSVWLIWTIFTISESSGRAHQYYTVDIPRSHHVYIRFSDNDLLASSFSLPEFVGIYHMSEIDFKEKIVLRGIQLSAQEYADTHPDVF